MAENSKIEWTDHTFNPAVGCEKVSPGCKNCYAEREVERYGHDFTKRRRTSEQNWKKPLRWNKKPFACDNCGTTNTGIVNCGGTLLTLSRKACSLARMAPHFFCEECKIETPHHRVKVFCASWSDWLDDKWDIEWLADLLKLIHDTPNLDWLLLTKRPENWRPRLMQVRHQVSINEIDESDSRLLSWLADWLSGLPPNNVWIGTTVEDQKRADERIADLIEIPAKVHFLSCEPLLESLDLDYWLTEPLINQIDWVICGGESGHKKRPFNCDWARQLRDQCKAAGVPFFMKQVDKVQPIPADLMIREFPV